MSALVEQRVTSSLKKSRPYSEPLPSNNATVSYPAGIKPELLDAWSLKCAFVVDEILHTEQDYIASLEGIIEGYRVPLSNHLHSTNEGSRVVGVIFGNIEDLYELHQMLLEKLQLYECDPHEFGQVFLQTEDGFKLYIEYCTNYNSALECLQNQLKNSKEMRELILRCQKSLGQSLDLTSQLIKPVQRIMKYHLMLQELVKKFNPNHYGYPSLCHAHLTMAQIADHINQVKKQKENAIRVQDIQSYLSGWRGKEAEKNLSAYGELMFESSCRVGKKGAERLVILFEKLLLILKKKDEKHYNYKGHILAKELCVDENEVDGNSAAFKVYSSHNPNQIFEIQAFSAKKRKEWIAKIKHLCLVVLQREEEEEEEEYKQFVKRRKTFFGSEMGTGSRNHRQPKRSQSEGKIQSRRIPWPKKRTRVDVRQVFHDDDEKEIPITNGMSQDSATSTVLPSLPESSSVTMEVVTTDPSSLFDSGHYQTSLDKPGSEKSLTHSLSDDSLLSLEDVELTGDFNEWDGGDEKPRRRKKRSTPSRKTAIKVKRNRSFREPSSLNASQGESELSRLISPPTRDRDSSLLLDSSMESDTLYQSGHYSVEIETDSHEYVNEGVIEGGVARDGRSIEFDSGVHVGTEHKKSSGALGVTLIRESRDGMMVGDNDEDQSDTLKRGEDPLLEESGVMILDDNSESKDIVIMEDSSDSEDEDGYEAEGYQSIIPLSPIVELGTSVDPPGILSGGHGDQEVPFGDNTAGDHVQELSMGEFGAESYGDLVDISSQDTSHFLHDDSSDHTSFDTSLPLQGRNDIELYATLPRKSRTKTTTPSPRSSMSTPGIGGTKYVSSSSTLSRDRPGSKRFRSAQFNQLLEFTRQQASTPGPVSQPSAATMRRTSAPEGVELEYEVTQSLPVSSMANKSLKQLLESHNVDAEQDTLSQDTATAIATRISFTTHDGPGVEQVEETHPGIENEGVSQLQTENLDAHVETPKADSSPRSIDESDERNKQALGDSTRESVEEAVKRTEVPVHVETDVTSSLETSSTKIQQDNTDTVIPNHVKTDTKSIEQINSGTDKVVSEQDKLVQVITPISDSKIAGTETTTQQVIAEHDSKRSTPPLLEKLEEETMTCGVSTVQRAPDQELTRRITSRVTQETQEEEQQATPLETTPLPQTSSPGVLGLVRHWTMMWGHRVRNYLPSLNVRSGLILVGIALFSSYMIYSRVAGSRRSGIDRTDSISEPRS